MTIEFEGIPFEEQAAKVIHEFLKPDDELGWVGVPWFTQENAKELVGHLWENGFVIRRML